MEWEQQTKELISRRIRLLKPNWTETLSQLKIRNNFEQNSHHVNRSGVEFGSPSYTPQLQIPETVSPLWVPNWLLPMQRKYLATHETLNHPNLILLYRYRLGMYSGKSSLRISPEFQICEPGTGRRSAHRFILISRFRSEIQADYLEVTPRKSANLMLFSVKSVFPSSSLA